MNKNLQKWVLGTALGVFFVWFATRGWPVEHIFGHSLSIDGGYLIGGDLGSLTPSTLQQRLWCGCGELPMNAWRIYLPWILPYVGILVLIHFIRAWRWAPLLRANGHDVPFSVLNSTGGISFAAIFLLPLRVGEFVRPALLKRWANVRMSEGMALVVLERVIDGLIVTFILLAVLLYMPVGDPEAYRRIHLGALISLAVFGGGLLGIIGAYLMRTQLDRFLEARVRRFAPRLVDRVRGILSRFYRGLGCMPNVRIMFLFTAVTVFYWLINGFGYYAMARAFGYDFGLIMGLALMAAVVIGMMIPNPPGNVGTFWFFLLLPMTVYGVTDQSVQAVVFALFVWFIQMAQMTLFGIYFISKTTLRISDIQDLGHESEDMEPNGTASGAASSPTR